nr:MAG TPA: hypothetical protein [Caudoviricetes sp.]
METLSNIVDTIQEKLGKEESGKIADSLANILVIEEAHDKTIKEKDASLEKIKKDKEMLIEANGNLLLHQASAKEGDSFFDEGNNKKEEPKEPFDFRSVFDNKGHFKR